MAALAYVGAAVGNADTASTTAATAARNVTTNNHLFVYVRWESADVATLTCADNAGNTYTALAKQFNTRVGGRWFYCLNATGNAALVATATWATGQSFKNIRLLEFSGDAPVNVALLATLSDPTTGTTTLNSATAGSIDLGTNSFYLVGMSSYNGIGTPTYADGFSLTATRVGTAYGYADTAYVAAPSGIAHTWVTLTQNSSTAIILQTLTLDSAVSPPSRTTTTRVSQVPVEVVRTNTAVVARVSQLPVEVIRKNNAVVSRVSQVAVEVLRPNAAAASTGRPVVMVCT